ncbi:MAG: hypothetical protein JW881_01205 [Spirochaetales bacterium]|nr:hypothetical protein [Spirochaetales bacterium]
MKRTDICFFSFVVVFAFLFPGCDGGNGNGTGEYSLTIDCAGNGSVSPGSGSFGEGMEVVLSVSPDTGWYFDAWGGDDAVDAVDNGDGTFSIIMDGDKHIVARFLEGIKYGLFITTSGQGSVEKDPSAYSYNPATVVDITPVPDSGWYFDSWNGDDAGSVSDEGGGIYSIVMDGNKQLEAVFGEYVQLTLSWTEMGTCSGTTDVDIAVDPEGAGEGLFEKNTEVTITITCGSHTTFDGWSGTNQDDVVALGENLFSIVMNEDKSISAMFGLVMFSLTISVSGEGYVEETSNCHNVYFGITGNDYVEDFTVLLKPQQLGEASFSGWEGTDAGDITDEGGGIYSIIMDADKSIEALFE